MGDDFLKRISSLSQKQLVLLAGKLQAKLEGIEAARQEPVAVIGLGCRFPGGGDSPEAFWRVLEEGVNCARLVGRDRWDMDAFYDPDPAVPGKMYTRHAALLDTVDDFDAEFFSVPAGEAGKMDPQQRLLLEVAWEAIENAGYAPPRLSGSRTAVFVGVMNHDYEHLQNLRRAFDDISGYVGVGTALSVAAGRLSYFLGLKGPSVALDTACSSSLVTVHLACQSLRHRESDLALAGGVNLILSPTTMIAESKAMMLAPDGRCKTFDASADGYGRGEGCGIVVLKRLADARRDGDTVLAVIRGSAVNQDGRSQGLTAPNGPAQQAVIEAALANAGVQPQDVDYVEAHGTGTPLGDPIEIQALGAVYGAARANGTPLLVGSVKTNVGHLESAAGVAGLIKLILALQHRTIPAHLNLQKVNPHIDLERHQVAVPTAATPWPTKNGKKRVGATSSFGFSGTNAHVIVEEAEAREAAVESGEPERGVHVLALSAKSEAALQELAGR
ncbi:MAG TPA: polyketide synthase, partial [Burkholderiales bacterium]|nr:polyketide synthase [Burkholderiales bacterium]